MNKTRIVTIAILGIAMSAHAATRQWSNTGTGDFGTAMNWIGGVAPTSADVANFTNNGTATISDGQSYTVGALNLAVAGAGKTGSGTLSMSGGSLSVTGATVVGYNGIGTGTLNMIGTSRLTSGGNVQVGNANTGILNVGSTATGSCAALIIGITDLGLGTMNLAGTWDAASVIFGNSATATLGSGTLNLTNNFKLTTTGNVRSINKNQADLNVYGSGGLFSVGGDFIYTNTAASLSFIADAGGFTTINVATNINITGSKLNINLDAYVGPTNTPLVLMSGASITGGFSNITWLGTSTAYVAYSTTNVVVTWTDPSSIPRLPTTMQWIGTTGSFADSNNWDKVYVPMAGDELRITNGGTAVISSGTNEANYFTLGYTAQSVGNLSVSAGRLILGRGLDVALAQSATGSVSITGSSMLECGTNLNIGVRGLAVMDVGSFAEVSALYLRVGVYGPDVSATTHGDGTLNLSGKMVASNAYVSSSGGIGVFNLNNGTVVCAGDFFMNNGTQYTQRAATLNVNGSSGSFSAQNFYAADTNVTVTFKADAGGFTVLNVMSNIDVTGSALAVDLTDYSGTNSFVLMDGGVWTGTFASTNFTGLGIRTAELVYNDTDKSLVLNVMPVQYTLIVNNGSGSGSYTNGQIVTITADSPASGYAFDKWTGDTAYLADSNVASTTVTMPTQAISVTATYIASEQYTASGTPYSWLDQYGLTNHVADDVLDQDMDGLLTWQEYIAGTIPTNPVSVLKVHQASRNVISWTAQPGRTYSVYWSTNLANGFTNLASNALSPYTNTAPDAGANYYRVKVQWP